MEFCILAKGDVLVVEDIAKTETAEIILALFKQGFVLAPILIEANNAENARLVFINRFQWRELGEAMTNRQFLKG
ncbi:hypothetical protein Q4519_11470 [Motilimonas sp. 1_MG-2023]|uniref:hypothetical protein n=1 Tax=Motilimonas sp. 1_MG-2023 TaxID=3062672 RepID=UPI0026E46B79|nr:hypothetical protein [Motilimonas sp. 1_MG-2023]MDO6526302.1 hypothetical protein [Motilimonas sp. 1_MG-2023]